VALSLAVVPAWSGEGRAQEEEGTVHIREVDVDAFPQVSITISTGGQRELGAEDVRVTEAGRQVPGLSVRALVEAGQQVDVVLVLDTSGSMKGEPLASAIAAALQFVTDLPADGIRVGIVTFSDSPRVLQPLTTDHGRALEALGALVADGETALYDAVAEAAGLFSGPAQRNVIVLSDGGDTVSQTSLKGALAAARGREAAVFTVGLSTGETDVAALRKLSERTGGRYSPAGTADLSAVYQSLAGELSGQYVVSYRSTRRSGGQVTLVVTAPGGTDRALILLPSVAAPPAPTTPTPGATPSPLLGGSAGMLVALGLFFLAAFVLLVMVLGARDRIRRDRDLVTRMAASSVSDQEPQDRSPSRGLIGWIPEPLVAGSERLAAVAGFTPRLERTLERAGLPLRPGELLAGTALASVLGILLGGALLRNPVLAVLLGAVGGGIPVFLLYRTAQRRTKRLHGQLPDVLMILASSLRAGHSFFQALDTVAKEIGEPGSAEFNRVVAEVRLGRPVEEALTMMADRIGSEDFKWAVLGVNVQRQVGGNLAEVLDTVADTIRERDTIRRQIDVLSAEGKLSIGILAALPFLVAAYIAKVNPGYLNLLFSTRTGLVMLVTAGCLMAVGIAWMRKVVNIDV
jgi:tight adherence protein B